MAYSSLYESQAREKLRISPYEELRVVLNTLKNRDLYIVVVPTETKIPKRVLDSVTMADSIDVFVEGEECARNLATKVSRQTGQPAGIAKYENQTPAQLQAELSIARSFAEERKKRFASYSEWKKTA